MPNSDWRFSISILPAIAAESSSGKSPEVLTLLTLALELQLLPWNPNFIRENFRAPIFYGTLTGQPYREDLKMFVTKREASKWGRGNPCRMARASPLRLRSALH